MPYLSVCEGELARHVDQVALFRVALHPQVPVVLHFWWMRPVLVALGLPEHDTNCQIRSGLTRVNAGDTIWSRQLRSLLVKLRCSNRTFRRGGPPNKSNWEHDVT